jgi:hypothetical protein
MPDDVLRPSLTLDVSREVVGVTCVAFVNPFWGEECFYLLLS